MFNIFYNPDSGKIISIAQAKASSEAMVNRLKKKWTLCQTTQDTAMAQKLMTGQLNLKEYRIMDGRITKVALKNPLRPGKFAARQTFQKIEKEFVFEGNEVQMTILYHYKNKSVTIHFGDNVEFEPNRILYLFFTLEDDPTILEWQIEFPLTNEPHIFGGVPADLTKCGIYTIRHFTNINYREVE